MENTIINNQDFLNILKEKLTKGSKRSIHLNALPRNSATRLDLVDVDLIDNKFSDKFLEKLLTQSKFKLEITFDKEFEINEIEEPIQKRTQKTIRRFKSISKQNKDYYLEHGLEPFGFGFPIVYKRDQKDPKSIIKAPLLIWSLEIEEDRKFANKWIIRRDEDFPIYFNDVLISHIENDENIKIEGISKEFLEDSIIDETELTTLTHEFLSRFGSNLTNEEVNALLFKKVSSDSLLNKEELITNKPTVVGSGVFGLYVNQKQSIIKDITALTQRIEGGKGEALVNENFLKNPFCSVTTDPSQQLILNHIYKNQKIIIHGPPGTGKSQSLTAIITNALSNHSKCLVVCEKRTALEVVFNNLKKVGLDKLCALVEDTSKDRRPVIDKARETIDDVLIKSYRYQDYNYNALDHLNLVRKTQNKIDDLNAIHKQIDTQILGDDNFSNIAGKLINIRKQTNSIDILDKVLPNSKFNFNQEEFKYLNRIIDEAADLLQHYNPSFSSLELINLDLIKDKQHLDIKSFFETDLQEKIDANKELINLFPESRFKEIQLPFLKIGKMFSKKLKKEYVFAKAYLEYLLNLNHSAYLKEKQESLKNYSAVLNQMHALNSSIEQIIQEQNSIVYCIQWHNFFESLKKNEKELIIGLIDNADDFKLGFLGWYYNRTLNSNYIAPIKEQKEIDFISESMNTIEKGNSKKILTYWQSRRINSIGRYNKTNSYLNAKQLYAKVNRNNRKKSLRQIIKQDFDLFTDIFPVILVNPTVCSSLFDLKESLFDFVIFDEASQLRIEDTFSALIRGKVKIVSGDEHQMPPSSYFSSNDLSLDAEDIEDEDNEEVLKRDSMVELANKESLLEYASEMEYANTYLDIHYRSRHPFLIDFSNAAFYNNRLSPIPAKTDYKPIHYVEVMGTYENQTNYAEARKIIELLKTKIKSNTDGSFPSIGIATFNLNQRNLIWEEINKEALQDEAFGHRVEEMFANGLFIKNLENIQGDERDIIIMSTTFGLNKEGAFKELFGPLNNKTKGHRLLNVIITRAKHHLYVCTSFPRDRIAQYKDHIQQNGNIGRGLLFAYLAYVKSIEDNDLETRSNILNLLSGDSKPKGLPENGDHSFFETESPFEDEVVDSLIKQGIPKEQIQTQYQLGGFRIDIVLLSPDTNKPIIAIECDGASYHSSQEAYAWDIFRQKQLEEYGLKFIRVWSTNWWQNQEEEEEQMLLLVKSNLTQLV